MYSKVLAFLTASLLLESLSVAKPIDVTSLINDQLWQTVLEKVVERPSLEKELPLSIEELVLDKPVLLTPELRESIRTLPHNLLSQTLKGWIVLTEGSGNVDLIEKLPVKSRIRQQWFRLKVAQALKTKQLKRAEGVLKSIPDDALMWARYYFQLEEFGKAIEKYQSISRKSLDFWISREELAWAFLRAHDLGGAQGQLTHLNTPLVPLELRLEGRILSSIVHLRNCRFNDVEKEITEYQKEMSILARDIDSVFIKGKSVKPRFEPERLAKAHMILKQQKEEALKLSKRTKTKSLVWEDKIRRAQSIYDAQLKRTWVGYKAMVEESILKMSFVRLELLTLLHRIEKNEFNSNALTNNDLLKNASQNKMVYRVTKNEIWADELFRARTVKQPHCENL